MVRGAEFIPEVRQLPQGHRGDRTGVLITDQLGGSRNRACHD
jgi:hypothetical protein